ncbi:DNA polymerase-3 subunit alpha (Gram-positive type) [Moryella indoligenes]|uniref:DNA polymerase III PolC-type n=1 Tax=Moryella indoligenes TaxID=371674 RepID=A0AAE3VB92_9FIRM|nr:PolC-type DNA polymerase III [Moryella indoligenes]MDQ0152883.1 DNA polymerase-3 subunit alpha (Gram-positive type) [Moryella indoligenes]
MKQFTEVFRGFAASEADAALVELLSVERVTASEDMSSLSVWINCPRLIESSVFRGLEQELKRQLFQNKRLSICIHERFTLSGSFTPEMIFDAYKDSVLAELQRKNLIAYRILSRAECSFSENCMEFTVEDMPLNRNVVEKLRRYLSEEIFERRCGMSVELKPHYIPYIPPKEEQKNIAERAPEREESRGEEESFLISDTASLAVSDSLPLEGEEEKRSPRKEQGPGESGHSTASKKPEGQKNGRKPGGGFTPRRDGRSFRGERPFRRGPQRPDNPDVLYGRDFEDEFIALRDVNSVMGEVSIRGQIFELDSFFIERSGSTLFIFSITDFTDSITVKLFFRGEGEELDTLKGILKKGSFLKLRGVTSIDNRDGELIIGSVRGIKKCEPFQESSREDHAPKKRVELHCHTKMSDLDAVSSAEQIIKQAKRWGMDAIAITDHGNLQAFPEAWHTVSGDPLAWPKIIYGVEGYLVDDLKELVVNPGEKTLDDSFVVFDLETTGFSAVKNQIIEIGAVKVVGGKITERFSSFVNPRIPIPFRIEQLTHISDAMVSNAPGIEEVLPEFLKFCEGSAVVAHNAGFDTGFIREKSKLLGLSYHPTILDTVSLAHILLPRLNRYKLDTVARELGVSLDNHHRAVDDAGCTAEIFVRFVEMLKARGLHTLREVSALSETNPDVVRKMNTYHVIILVKNELGRVNLYRLVSDSNLKYFNKKPRIPKSELKKYREGLIIGSACEAGELFQAMLRDESEEAVNRIASFYDYLEIQPIGNNLFMIGDDHYTVESEEDLRNINRRIVKLGEDLGKPVVATCDVHFLNPEDEIYRRMIFFGNKYSDADSQPPLFLRTTEEMLEEFEYLGAEKCEEVVITNTRRIAAMVERISPVRPDKCPPVIADSDKKLTEACYQKAYEQYGNPLPEIVRSRLEKELGSIIKNGFAVMYIIAQELVRHSNEEGYLVGSRGSVGSSFVAYTAGITEVNPLPPHYFCPECQYSDFDSEVPQSYAGTAGCDMPDAVCPHCGAKLKKDGFDIPFETFLGFKGDKEPDIDLNFSGENQSSAHAYTEVIFGKGQTYRAGTVGTLAEKTAFGYVKNYFEEHGARKRKCEINRLVQGCIGVRRTTGQHPGGIVVLPKGESIYSFTPIQHPANDMNTPIVTTHFEYHAIDHNLLKLDILGHQDPTMIRMLQDLTHIDPVKDIPLDSPEVMSLFQSPAALKVKPEDILGCKLGALGIPEFGTDFAMNMVLEAKPKGFSDLVRIAGLAHGTDVWQGNAEVLISEGTATIKTAICTRDDIMLSLIKWGLEPQESFKIMESVRKGKGLKPEWEADMRAHEVPDWYIWSCKKIKYMFPKAHAAAYVMMAWRIGYCKIFYPLAYYAAYFTIRATGFSYEVMCQGQQRLEFFLAELKKRDYSGNRSDPLSPKEADMIKDGRIAQEMYARGFEFMPIDLYQAHATRFSIVDGKIMPALTSIDGLGESAALQIVEAAKQGEFISKDDFKSRSGTGQTTCDLLDRLGILGKLPESNQLSIFDL